MRYEPNQPPTEKAKDANAGGMRGHVDASRDRRGKAHDSGIAEVQIKPNQERKMKNMADENQKRKSLHVLLSELDDGGTSAQLDGDLEELMRKTLEVAVSRGQAGVAAGKMTIALTFKVTASGEVEIETSHTIKAPKFATAKTRRWVDPKTAAIIDQNPKQTALPLVDAIKPNELRSV